MSSDTQKLRIDIVSDVSCPWCIIGYKALEQALSQLTDSVKADIHWQPFELNPNMLTEGEDVDEHLMNKYRIDEKQIMANRENIHQRGLSVGYEFGHRGGGRIYNTFDAHRLLHWAAEEGKQTELKLALFDLYFKDGGNPSDHEQLVVAAGSVGLDVQRAKSILASDEYSQEVRKQQTFYQQHGISSVPAVIVNNKHLISGGQPTSVFVQALTQISQEAS
ncbi:DsbA family oxidoreductase [Glaciecola sp. XM2]|jgi:predicted DsbA family dithiol-disulfide isomerase|uniref:DsbA family oxidoreductase n=1 Tax=Glaciecola sp. XM2 TaxID=1914931 RepID=UPI001BDE0005|nr:DsbA family oxidoreductase [Glaciecola sp. XM2]MBT1451266.1 DsbA family oxidoreductase [Glaciecola sp. XM2]